MQSRAEYLRQLWTHRKFETWQEPACIADDALHGALHTASSYLQLQQDRILRFSQSIRAELLHVNAKHRSNRSALPDLFI